MYFNNETNCRTLSINTCKENFPCLKIICMVTKFYVWVLNETETKTNYLEAKT